MINVDNKLQQFIIKYKYGKWIKTYEFNKNNLFKYPDIIYSNYNDLNEFYKFTNCIIKRRNNYLIEIFEKKGNEFITNLIHYKFIPNYI